MSADLKSTQKTSLDRVRAGAQVQALEQGVPPLLEAETLRDEIRPLQLLGTAIATASKAQERVALQEGDQQQRLKQFVHFLFDRRFGWSESNQPPSRGGGSSPSGASGRPASRPASRCNAPSLPLATAPPQASVE